MIKDRRRRAAFRTRRKLDKPGLVSHITQHAAGRDPMFLEDADHLYYLGLLKEVSSEHKVKILAFCNMSNHAHILLQQQVPNLSRFSKILFHRYAVYFNRKYSRRGHLFSSSFRQVACLNDNYLLSVSIYIHLNPVRAGLAGSIPEYRWSSWQLYFREDPPESFIDSSFVLGVLGKDRRTQVSLYQSLCGKAVAAGEGETIEKASGRMAMKILFDRAFGLIRMSRKQLSGVSATMASDEELEQMVREISQPGRGKSQPLPESRLFVIEQLEARGFLPEQIAEFLGISRATYFRILDETKNARHF